MPTNQTIILYHANCLDGFGAAYAAWKKFADTADYIAVSHGNPPPENLEGKEVYIVDFSYSQEILSVLEQKVSRLVILDHHIGSRAAVESVKEHVFDNERSGAGITWDYFHPQIQKPKLIAYIQDGDLWKHALPNHKEIAAYLGTVTFSFVAFDALREVMEDETKLLRIIEKGAAYSEYFNFVCSSLETEAKRVLFDEFEILAVNAPRLFRSFLGHKLARKKGPFSIVWYPQNNFWHCSMRGDGSIDLSLIAQRYGGNGHRNAASFVVPIDTPLPFTSITP